MDWFSDAGSIPAASTIIKPSKFRLIMRIFEGYFLLFFLLRTHFRTHFRFWSPKKVLKASL